VNNVNQAQDHHSWSPTFSVLLPNLATKAAVDQAAYMDLAVLVVLAGAQVKEAIRVVV